MFYQVLIEVTGISKANFNLFEFDKESKEEIIDHILIPYLKEEEFQFNGYFLKRGNVLRIVVKTTAEPAKYFAEMENNTHPEGLIMYTAPADIVTGDYYTTDITRDIVAEAKSLLATENKMTNSKQLQEEEIDRTKVFIVHGHDEVVKESVARFLQKIGLTPIILHEQASQGKTIIEKIEDYSNVGFGIVLYTPCDLGKVKDSESLQPRARQNVIFEHGYLMAKIGRNNVCALVKDDVEKPNDISGIVYINYNSNWNWDLLKELKSSGYQVDANLLI
ncbi:nucleotide-binding protein [Lysinibacillus sphaericus]|uniref:TIR domain-containing protein n=1 Tax=Lysinibacillus sphaericus TaxID=1421 RepID=UPI000564F990|nr:nucleotide-binding protein [Lysinibacillus sphaericus]QTB23706.1 nucleotide-binding protein [Lysinibacillus sphaericus]